MSNKIKTIANINITVGVIMLVLPIFILLYYIFISTPQKVGALYSPDKENEIIAKPIFTDRSTIKDPFATGSNEVQPLEFNIPNYEAIDIGTRIRIPTIGLDTTVYESKSPTYGLGAGVWRDPLYGAPDRPSNGPTVLAAHRWGEDRFSWEYRYANLFTKFDQLKEGERITITWNNTEYDYVIRHIEQNTQVTGNADLIMYTCVYYNSPERIFVYADRVN